MTEKELKIRVAFWYEKFERISNDNDIIHRQVTDLLNQTDKMKAQIDIMKKRAEKNSFEIVQVIKELEQLKEQERKMSFDNITLQK
ncbi:hypothetical protein ES707_16959 [subsurface metagenome]